MTAPLNGIVVVNIGQNLPGPRAAQILKDQGAHVIKVEPPSGDTFAYYCPPWYEAMHQDVKVHRLDLKSDAGREGMFSLLERADVLITSHRPSTLARLGLAPETLRDRFPRLAIVNIVGATEDPEHPGHDLTYQAQAGLLTSPRMPATLIADLAGAQQAAITALALLRAGGGVQQVGLSDAAFLFREPLDFGLTGPGQFLGGGHAGYNIYATRDGHIALAALEFYYWPRLRTAFPDLPDNPLDPEAHRILTAGFRQRTTAAWLTWARTQGVPLEPLTPTATTT